MKKMSLDAKKKINGGLRSVKGKYVLLGLAALAGAADGGLRYYEAAGSAGDPVAAAQERALLEKDIRAVEGLREQRNSLYFTKEQDRYKDLGRQIFAAAESTAPDFTFARNLPTRELAGLALEMEGTAYEWRSGAMVPGKNEDNVAAIHLCQNDILSRPGIRRDDMAAREIVQCSIRTHDKTADIALWCVSLTLLGLMGKGLLQGQFRKSIERDEHALHAAKVVQMKSMLDDQGNLKTSAILTLDRDIQVKPIKLSMKPQA